MSRIQTIEEVVNYQLCTGCGACAAVEPERYQMRDVEQYGYRPELMSGAVQTRGDAFEVCPGHRLEHRYDRSDARLLKELEACWGPVYGVWEGYAADEEIRYNGSSGGAATALSLFGLEQRGVEAVVQSGPQASRPLTNETKLSRTRANLLANAGSRYAPASPCSGLGSLPPGQASAVFVGKPCDVAAVRNWEALHPDNANKFAVRIGFFCAGTPSTQGNKRLLEKSGLNNIAELLSLKFRGQGWPGMWRAVFKVRGKKEVVEKSYAESWGYLQKFRQWRCYICPDHSGEFADISVGDPWYRPVEEGEPGKSLIIARTREGWDYLKAAQAANYIVLERHDPSLLPRSQPNLIKARGDLWGRLLTLKVLGAPVPRFVGFEFFKFFRQLSLKAKLSALYGTATRIRKKKLKKNQGVV